MDAANQSTNSAAKSEVRSVGGGWVGGRGLVNDIGETEESLANLCGSEPRSAARNVDEPSVVVLRYPGLSLLSGILKVLPIASFGQTRCRRGPPRFRFVRAGGRQPTTELPSQTKQRAVRTKTAQGVADCLRRSSGLHRQNQRSVGLALQAHYSHCCRARQPRKPRPKPATACCAVHHIAHYYASSTHWSTSTVVRSAHVRTEVTVS